jgi:hypothetical protein
MSVTEIQVYKVLQSKLGDETAQELVKFLKSEINAEFMDCKQVFLVKEDKVDLMRTIYLVGLVQFLAIMASLIGILSFFFKSGG